MPVPWAQIVRLMPSILDLSRELLRSSRRLPPPEPAVDNDSAAANAALEARINSLEENQRRQAELVTRMADQLAQLTTAVTALHRQTRRLLFGQIATALAGVIAIVLALR